MTGYIAWFRDIRLEDLPLVGGKNASLGELYGELTRPGSGCRTASRSPARPTRRSWTQSGLRPRVAAILEGRLRRGRGRAGQSRGRRSAARPGGTLAGRPRARRSARPTTPSRGKPGRIRSVAVRSSATAEDLPEASFAGQQETFLGVRGADALVAACRRCFASLFTDRAIVYRIQHGFDHLAVRLSIGVQHMVRADLGAAGVMFTLDPESGFPGRGGHQQRLRPGRGRRPGTARPRRVLGLQADAARGPAGDSQAHPRPEGLEARPRRRRHAGAGRGPGRGADRASAWRTPRCSSWRGSGSRSRPTTRRRPVGRRRWTSSGRATARTGASTSSRRARRRCTGPSAGRRSRCSRSARPRGSSGSCPARRSASGSGSGRARRLRDPRDLARLGPGEVLVAPMTDPDWEPVMKRAAAIVTDRGGRTCHAAIVSRELGVPCVVGTERGTELIPEGETVTVSLRRGRDSASVYRGARALRAADRRSREPALPGHEGHAERRQSRARPSASASCRTTASAWPGSSSSSPAWSGCIRSRSSTRSASPIRRRAPRSTR